jgi:stage IV sporulation protein A
MNVEQLRTEDIETILQNVLYEFPLTEIEFYMPKWVELLEPDHRLKKDVIEQVKKVSDNMHCIRDVIKTDRTINVDSDYIKKCKIDKINPENGTVSIYFDLDQKYYYEMISEMIDEDIQNEYQFLNVMKELAGMKNEYVKVMGAVEAVRFKGYGVVTPERSEITLEKPELIRHGNKFGVKIKAESPSIHMIRANIETEIAPIVGTEEQAKDLISYISDAEADDNGIWDTNIFGKTVEQLVQDGITSKVSMIGEESQVKLQESMQKIVNESNGGMVCIII